MTPSPTLHGSDPKNHPVALLLVDVINPLDFPGSGKLLPHALAAADRLADLRRRAVATGVPVVYANDNFGRWRSDLRAVVARCEEPESVGRPLAERLRPGPDDYFVLKPKHSAFFGTTLDTLLRHLGTKTLVLGGIAGNICVLFTAADAHMRDFNVVVPADACASNTPDENAAAVETMRTVLKADTRAAAEVQFSRLASAAVADEVGGVG